MATSAAKTAGVLSKGKIFSTYRTLTRLLKVQPSHQNPETQIHNLRNKFRKNVDVTDPQEIHKLMQEAGEKIAYLRIITPKNSGSSRGGFDDDENMKPGRWVYTKDGPVQIDGEGNARRNGKILSNWDGKNLDPCSVKRHNYQLKRMGFVNNLHAKGLF